MPTTFRPGPHSTTSFFNSFHPFRANAYPWRISWSSVGHSLPYRITYFNLNKRRLTQPCFKTLHFSSRLVCRVSQPADLLNLMQISSHPERCERTVTKLPLLATGVLRRSEILTVAQVPPVHADQMRPGPFRHQNSAYLHSRIKMGRSGGRMVISVSTVNLVENELQRSCYASSLLPW